MSIFYLCPPIDAVFIHIPKTGGSSIRNGVYKQYSSSAVHGDISTNWPKDRTFAFVRHPLERFISGWAYTGKIEFERLLDIIPDEKISPAWGDKIGQAKHHLLPQTHPFYYLRRAKHIGRFETLQDSFKDICHKLQIPHEDLPKLNTSEHRSWQEEIPSNLVGRFIEMYRQDFDQLDYRIP